MTDSPRHHQRNSRHRGWGWYGLLSLVTLILITAGAVLRGFWWPIPFQSAARHALAKYENSQALAWLNWATCLAPEDAETAFLRARANRRLGDLTQARAAIQRARRIRQSERLEREDWLCTAQTGQLQNIERHIPELFADPRGDTEEIKEAIFLGCILSQRHDDAYDILESWIEEFPDHPRPYLQRAKFWELKSKTAKAIEDLRRVIELSPDNDEAAVELATMLQSRNRFSEAAPLFERCLKVPRYGARAHVGLALCLKSLGENSRVKGLLEQAVKLDPSSPQALCELGRFDLEVGNYATAVAKLTDAVRVAPRDEDCNFVLAQALIANGQRAEAKPYLDLVQTMRDDFAELTRCEGLLAKSPRNVNALVTSGSIQLRGDDPEDGIARLLAALAIEPDQPTARKLLVDYLSRNSDKRPEYRELLQRFRN
jgi:tetratricopeptide (TPR) repeat protein